MECCRSQGGASAGEQVLRRCPACDRPGQAVPRVTLQSLYSGDLRDLCAEEYRFCRTPDCAVAYFCSACGRSIPAQRVRVAIWQKQPHAATPVCYCFGYTLADLRADHRRQGRSTVVAAITAAVQAGQCACAIRNPQGSCCLGNVRAVLRTLEAEEVSDGVELGARAE
ncbi:putative iron-sulfur cluster-binding metallochaperone [Kallotenue papyrolyticum]|uniref:putative iron-sulfur cluster-binding metallochaperone n=1 Tax=Kallotenue papyrolyticum TaxID=1325125 RepID=UPI0023EDFFFB|nr:hypothetical protein [Kallotenue papyrolyticum]